MADIKRESLDVDLLIVGAGPAGLAAAIHLADLMVAAKAKGELKGAVASDEFMMMVIEKGAQVGDHMLSGAVMDPVGLNELIPDWKTRSALVAAKVSKEGMYFLTGSGAIKVPYVPPQLNHHGGYVVSLNQLAKWLGKVAADKGVEVMTSTGGAAPIIEDGRFKGVVTDDKGIDKSGNRKANFEPGMELRAKITILAEGPRGSLTKATVPALKLDEERNPQSYLTGVKELWEVPAGNLAAGTVYHTLGFPLGMKHFGGGFIYAQSGTHIALGLCSSLAYRDPRFDPHGAFQQFKTHPWVRGLLKGGKMVKYGAKTISEGGYWAVPQIYHDGLMLVGESAGFLNSMRLKGIHLAIKSGMMAAQAAFEALTAEDYSAGRLAAYDRQYRESYVHKELWGVRNFHQAYEHGLPLGAIHTAAQLVTGGRGFTARLGAKADHLHMKRRSDTQNSSQSNQPNQPKFDGALTFDKLADVFASGTRHEENQPPHLHVSDVNICSDRCTEEYGNPCQFFCPAAVYEMVPGEGGKLKLQINASNCVHCKTCDVADPYGIITWVPPEGGGGPVYAGL